MITNDLSNLGGLNGLQAKPEPAKEAGSSNQLLQEDFLRLMTAQLSAQDPLKPAESGEFLSQLAQFGTVDGIGALKESFDDLSSSLRSLQALQASTMVGRNVLVASDVGHLPSEGSLEGAVDVGNATGGLLSITDVSGVIVHQQTLVPDENGVASFNWSGNKTTGERAAAGQYQLQAFGLVAGRNSALPTQVNASVSSVTVGQGGEGLTLNLQGIGAVDAADVLQIR